MAKVRLTDPPNIRSGAKEFYKLYKPWLLNNFYEELCCYCLLQSEYLEVDHYEPKSMSPNRINDPINLLPACRNCNGNKSDYHPQHIKRRTGKDIKSHVINPKIHDYHELYSISHESGHLISKDGPYKEQANENIVLLKFDIRKTLNTKRKYILNMLIDTMGLIRNKHKTPDLSLSLIIKRQIISNLLTLSKNEPMLICFGYKNPDYKLIFDEIKKYKFKHCELKAL